MRVNQNKFPRFVKLRRQIVESLNDLVNMNVMTLERKVDFVVLAIQLQHTKKGWQNCQPLNLFGFINRCYLVAAYRSATAFQSTMLKNAAM